MSSNYRNKNIWASVILISKVSYSQVRNLGLELSIYQKPVDMCFNDKEQLSWSKLTP